MGGEMGVVGGVKGVESIIRIYYKKKGLFRVKGEIMSKRANMKTSHLILPSRIITTIKHFEYSRKERILVG